MRDFFRFIIKYKEYFTFTILVIASLSLISVGDITKISGFRTVVIGSIGWLQSAFSWIPNTGALQSENSALRELNLQLSNEVTRMRNSIIENRNLRELINLKPTMNYETMTAEVIGKSNIELRNYYTLSLGGKDGVQEGMAVRSDAGLVGIIAGITDDYSLVELIINRNVKISAKTQRKRFDGILIWEGGESFKMIDIPKSYDVAIGDTIITSNYSSKYPSNIPVGYVVRTKELPGDIFARIEVEPFVNFSTLEQVFILKYISDPERLKLIQNIDERLKTRKQFSGR